MDAYIRHAFPGIQFDDNAALAKQGRVNNDLIAALEQHSFFKQPFPKTTGPELFNLDYLIAAQQRTNTTGLSSPDILATLNKFTAGTIAAAIKTCTQKKIGYKIFTSGGGMHNPLLMQHLKELLPDCTFETTQALGIDPDAKEAVLFAILANELVCGDPEVFGKGSKIIPAVTMGKISFPS